MTDNKSQKEARFPFLLSLMGILAMLGLLSQIAFLVNYSPITLMLFAVSHLLIAIAIILYLSIVIKDLRERKVL